MSKVIHRKMCSACSEWFSPCQRCIASGQADLCPGCRAKREFARAVTGLAKELEADQRQKQNRNFDAVLARFQREAGGLISDLKKTSAQRRAENKEAERALAELLSL